MHVLIATAGVLDPQSTADIAARIVAGDGKVTVATVIEVPRSFLDEIRSEEWHPLIDGMEAYASAQDAVIARWVEERGQRITEPVLGALRASGVEPAVLYLEGEDPAGTLIAAANAMEVDVVVVGATRHLFDEWESVSARLMRDLNRAVLVIPAPTDQ